MTLKARLTARPDDEHTQALLRISVLAVVLAYLGGLHEWRNNWTSRDLEIVQVLGGLLALAIAIFLAICVHPRRSVPRRLVGIMADAGSCTWFMWIAGEFGFFAIGVFLFIMFGNGFRYGRKYLFVSQFLCLAGMVSVLTFVPFWQAHRVAGFALLLVLLTLPPYVCALSQAYGGFTRPEGRAAT